ncbi:MAG TPA: hypothetical protein VJH04_01715 [archaeon]|nr:hypothetical protein [archaeon]
MPIIFQKFDLNVDEMDRLFHEEQLGLDPQAGNTLRNGLLDKGYEVLESNESYSGIPKSIIVGGDYGRSHKEDFYRLAEGLGLRFVSGEFYTNRTA